MASTHENFCTMAPSAKMKVNRRMIAPKIPQNKIL